MSKSDLDANVKKLLEQLRAELCRALGEARRAPALLDQLKDAGYDVHLLIDWKPRQESAEPGSDRLALPPARPLEENQRFIINAEDLAFLRSVGIDPTKSRKPRRRPVDEP